MSSLKLVRHPLVKSTESFYGYILRLVEENGYASYHQIPLMSAKRIRGGQMFDVHELASIANQSECELKLISYRLPVMGRSRCQLLGHSMRYQDLCLSRPRICPECILEKGFIEAHFDLHLMTGCPVHKRRLLFSCQKCSRPLRWSRPALLECECGADLSNCDLPSISQAECDLLDLFRRKLLELPIRSGCTSGLPLPDLQSTDLWCLLRIITILGKRGVHLKASAEGDQKLLATAANM